MKFKMIPSSIYPVSLKDILKILFICCFRRKESFIKTFRAYTGLPYCFEVSSGRAGLYLILLGVKGDYPHKQKILVPVMTCPSVVAAVKKAELEPVYYDISVETLGTDNASVKKLIDSETLAVVSSSLFGIPCNLQELREIADSNGIYLIEDNAQVFGVFEKGMRTGHFGHYSFFSFGKSKNFTTMNGGMVCTTDSKLAEKLRKEHDLITSVSFWCTVITSFQLMAYYLISIPFIFSLITRFKKSFSPDHQNEMFKAQRMSKLQKIIGQVLIAKFDKINEIRKQNSKAWSEALSTFKMIKQLDHPEKKPVFLRYPLLANDKIERDRLIKDFRSSGIWAMKSIYKLFTQDTFLYPNASDIVKRLLLLPVNHRIKPKIIHEVSNKLQQITAPSGM
jgi:dTDP-4-amino-4,6-dideoxygalactose transaminase